MKKIVSLAVAISGALLLSGCFECPHCKKEQESMDEHHKHEAASNSSIVSIAKQDIFDTEVLKSEKPVVVKFSAPWCGGCVQMKPIFEEVAKELGDAYKIVEINVDNADKSIMDKYEIRGIPAILIFNKGAKVGDTIIGVVQKDDLKKTIEAAVKIEGQPANPSDAEAAKEENTPQEENHK